MLCMSKPVNISRDIYIWVSVWSMFLCLWWLFLHICLTSTRLMYESKFFMCSSFFHDAALCILEKLWHCYGYNNISFLLSLWHCVRNITALFSGFPTQVNKNRAWYVWSKWSWEFVLWHGSLHNVDIWVCLRLCYVYNL